MSMARDTVRVWHGQAAATAAAVTATLGLAAASWVVAVRQMNGMDMGVATRLGSFAFFAALWVWMMAAMMLPGAVPAVVRRAQASGGCAPCRCSSGPTSPSGPWWASRCMRCTGRTGLSPPAWWRSRPAPTSSRRSSGTSGGAAATSVRSGFEFGLCCVGSSIGLMLMLVALSVMSVTWMCVIAVLVLAQKLLPAESRLDVPLALAIVGLGVLIVVAPSSVPGLTPPM